MSGLMEPESPSVPSAAPSQAKSAASPTSQSGTTMVRRVSRLSQTTLRSSWGPSPSTVTPSERAITSLSWLRPINGKIHRASSSNPLTQISVCMPRRYSTKHSMRILGSELNRSIRWLAQRPSSPHGLSAGLTMATLALKVLTIALSAQTTASAESLPTSITAPASLPASLSLAQMLKSCQASGSIKSVPSLASTWEISFGCLVTFYNALLKTSTCQSPSLPSSSPTGTALAATLTSQPGQCELELVAWNTSTKWWQRWPPNTKSTSNSTVTTTRRDLLASTKPLLCPASLSV